MKDKILFILKNPLRAVIIVICKLPYFGFISKTTDYQCRISFGMWFRQKVLNIGGNRQAYWPVHYTSTVYDPQNILVGVDAYPGIMKGCYIQGKGKIRIGDYTQIAPNVAIVSSNHDIYDTRKHIDAEVIIGKYCWIGEGAKIMPGVILGDWTIVGAGAVVTKSFRDGYCLIAGVPARMIRTLDREQCKPFSNKVLYNGYIASSRFEAYRKRYLNI